MHHHKRSGSTSLSLCLLYPHKSVDGTNPPVTASSSGSRTRKRRKVSRLKESPNPTGVIAKMSNSSASSRTARGASSNSRTSPSAKSDLVRASLPQANKDAVTFFDHVSVVPSNGDWPIYIPPTILRAKANRGSVHSLLSTAITSSHKIPLPAKMNHVTSTEPKSLEIRR